MTRLEKIIENIQKRMKDETFNRVKLKFLSTNVDRDIRVDYDSEDETYFVEKHKHIFDRYVKVLFQLSFFEKLRQSHSI